MENLNTKIFYCTLLMLLPVFLMSNAAAEETIIQKERLSFDRCLQVITISEDKLSAAPEITDVSDQKRVASFTLVDGTLTINCDGIEGSVTISTNTN